MLRPTIVGGTELARAFDVPLLGEIRGGGAAEAEVTRAAGIIAISAHACGRHEVDLMGVGRAADVAALADRLHIALNKQMRVVPPNVPLPDTFGIHVTNDAAPRYAATHNESGIKIRWFDPVPLRRRDDSGAIVLVTEPRATRAEVERARNLLQALARPVLGLVTCSANAPKTIRLEAGPEGEPSGSDTVTALVRGGDR
jgi:hypothetical protein